MILVTGGAGYIGAHVCLELLTAGRAVTVLDNLANGSAEALRRVERLIGRSIPFVKGDIRDRQALADVFRTYPIEAVIHLAGLKSVAESVAQPLAYYDCNVTGTIRLLEAMAAASIKCIVFSSSATVYGVPRALPLTEGHPLNPVNPYGRTKLVIEDILRDAVHSDSKLRVGILRYFNPVGAHPSGLIGEDPTGVPGNLVPYLAQVAVGVRPRLTVFGDNYPTADGTGIRDYVHVVDVAQAHIQAVDDLMSGGNFTLNLGTGRGYSVKEMVQAFAAASGREIACSIGPPREGDVAACYADPSAAASVLGWRARRGLAEMCEDHWRWQRQNPYGYRQQPAMQGH